MFGLLDAGLDVRTWLMTRHWCPLRITRDLIILSMTSNRLNTGNMITSNNFNLIKSSVISTPVWVLTFGVTRVWQLNCHRDRRVTGLTTDQSMSRGILYFGRRLSYRVSEQLFDEWDCKYLFSIILRVAQRPSLPGVETWTKVPDS